MFTSLFVTGQRIVALNLVVRVTPIRLVLAGN